MCYEREISLDIGTERVAEKKQIKVDECSGVLLI